MFSIVNFEQVNAGWERDYNFIKKETLAQVFSCQFCKISKNTFFTEHVWATASMITMHEKCFAADLVTFTEEIVNGKHFLCSVRCIQ